MYILSMSMFMSMSMSLSIQKHVPEIVFLLPSLKVEAMANRMRNGQSWKILEIRGDKVSRLPAVPPIMVSSPFITSTSILEVRADQDHSLPLLPIIASFITHQIVKSREELQYLMWSEWEGHHVNPNPGNQTTLISKKYVYAHWPPLCDWASFERANYSAPAKAGISTWFCCLCFKLANIHWPLTFHETFQYPSYCIPCKMYTFAKYVFIKEHPSQIWQIWLNIFYNKTNIKIQTKAAPHRIQQLFISGLDVQMELLES